MDVAKRRLAQWKEQSPEQWLATANKYLPPGVTAILVLALAYQLAGLTWSVVPGSTGNAVLPLAAAPAAGSDGAGSSTADFTTLLGSHLFGDPPQQAEQAPIVQETVVDAPDTTLSLELKGVVAGRDSAIISSNRGPDRAYHLGQEIENANGATLHSVYGDRVLLNRGDRVEALKLPKIAETGAAPQRAGGPFLAPAAAPVAQQGSLRQLIGQNATRLTEIIRLAPHIEEGNVVGFRATPGRDRETFEALGLKTGDVITDINGTQLTDPSNGVQVFESLGEATMANVTVLREGVPTVIVIDTTQLQNLQEGRE
jgi:general secretion pathway protein C